MTGYTVHVAVPCRNQILYILSHISVALLCSKCHIIVIETRDGITSDFYMGLPRIHIYIHNTYPTQINSSTELEVAHLAFTINTHHSLEELITLLEFRIMVFPLDFGMNWSVDCCQSQTEKENIHLWKKEGSFYIYSHSGYLNYENQVAWLYDLLTVMIASIGATNAQITPLSVDNQQLEATNGTKYI